MFSVSACGKTHTARISYGDTQVNYSHLDGSYCHRDGVCCAYPEDLTAELLSNIVIHYALGHHTDNLIAAVIGTELLTGSAADRMRELRRRHDAENALTMTLKQYSPIKNICVCELADVTQVSIGMLIVRKVGNVPLIGHYNDAGGFCCPHHGNTCGECEEYE